ncbi:conserved Plasmodium protein, unknown function [Plasmodium knowlesi strain H]|uniref:Uncharacterized protein n=3 Tax=Plasmodium knowlesi TaxID=5850 RepID=A0A5K1V265_PLAKH|nr:conserved Plasmodium protein, unknown function [Plasmodium knowlesi strain H]OTN68412.1 Uncharacterized protein PKNOH_S02295900 [Plasmodium knowlesi]CAA9986464.1 conserved Plasmodium protein, unknown function [Plasmodium knowlesi strain H]SBO24284.1 conserved Plasmodium protein, unknown function [Plasmodium knowlesi strain H]SBO29712.1 conserved Plasmodium protein, unknown function [Plasmodium knowlesi strain H]VVS75938.1 conserved Plasmodium protein, unknown function [Plasmodium knowlesi s|eukprot:XP_002261015.1 hypothetical protein, conserved in Plasmodium species [Plasmodium knowlesi strain H]
MNERIIKEKLSASINHLNKRRLKFDLKIFPIKKTVYEIFNIFSKELKKKFSQTLRELKKRKKKCDVCSAPIDVFTPFLAYEIDVNNTTFLFSRIEAYCSKCLEIKNFTQFSRELYQNVDAGELLNFAPMYEHYYQVNNLEIHQKNILQNDINNYFCVSVLAKNLRWTCSTPHSTFDEFLEYSLRSIEEEEGHTLNEDLPKKRKTEEPELVDILSNTKRKKVLSI